MVAQQQQERLLADERPGAPDGVTVALGLGLDGELQPLLEVDEPPRLFLGPVEPLVRRAEVGGIVAKVLAIDGLVARGADDADLLDPALDGLLGDDLEDGLGQPVAIDQRQHGLLHGVGRRVLPRPAAGRRDHRLGNLHRVLTPSRCRPCDSGRGDVSARDPSFPLHATRH